MGTLFFVQIDLWIDTLVSSLAESIRKGIAADILSLVNVSVTLYLIVFGYMILAGKKQVPVRDLLWELARFAIILAFLNNAGNLLDKLQDAVKELSRIGSGSGMTGLAMLDLLMNKVSAYATELGKQANKGADGSVSETLIAGLVWVGFGAFAFPTFLTFSMSKLTIYLLFALSPVALYCLMWGFFKNVFARWVSALLANALVLMLLSIVSSKLIGVLALALLVPLDANYFLLTFIFLGLGICSGMVIKQIVTVVNTIMQVSIERAAPGMGGMLKGIKLPQMPTKKDS